jgi:transposase
LAFYGEDAVDISTVHHWVRKLRDGGRNLDLNGQPQSGRPVTATHNRQKVNEVIQENRGISQTAIAQKLNIGLANVSKIIGLGYKKKWSMGVTSNYAHNEDSKTGRMSMITPTL